MNDDEVNLTAVNPMALVNLVAKPPSSLDLNLAASLQMAKHEADFRVRQLAKQNDLTSKVNDAKSLLKITQFRLPMLNTNTTQAELADWSNLLNKSSQKTLLRNKLWQLYNNLNSLKIKSTIINYQSNGLKLI